MDNRDFSKRQFEVHLTARADHSPPLPSGFWETLITNKNRQGDVVQSYVLHSCRFETLDQVPWDLKELYDRFKVEQKILKAYPEQDVLYLNENYFSERRESLGVEIHVRTVEFHADMIPSTVDDVSHQTVFLPITEPISPDKALGLVKEYGRSGSQLYIEAVLYDNNMDMDKEWEGACH